MEHLDYDGISFCQVDCFEFSPYSDSMYIKGKFEEIENLPKNVVTPTSYTSISFIKDGKVVDRRRAHITVSSFREKYGKYEVVIKKNKDDKPKGIMSRIIKWLHT